MIMRTVTSKTHENMANNAPPDVVERTVHTYSQTHTYSSLALTFGKGIPPLNACSMPGPLTSSRLFRESLSGDISISCVEPTNEGVRASISGVEAVRASHISCGETTDEVARRSGSMQDAVAAHRRTAQGEFAVPDSLFSTLAINALQCRCLRWSCACEG